MAIKVALTILSTNEIVQSGHVVEITHEGEFNWCTTLVLITVDGQRVKILEDLDVIQN